MIALYEVEARQDVLDAVYKEVFVDGHRKADGDKPIEPVDISPELQEKLRKALESDPALKAKYTIPAPVGERSDREFHLCGKLYAAGFSEGEIYTIMSAGKQEKWLNRGDDYRISTIRRAIEAEKSAASSEVDTARKTLEGLEESVKADPSAINRREVLQALAVLKQSDPIGYGIVIDGLGLTQTVKSAVKDRVKKIVNEQNSAVKKTQEEQTPPGIKQKALEILKIGKAVQFILDVLKLFHAGDRKSAELLLLSIAIGSCLNAYGTQPKLSGGSGKGKTHLCKAIRHLMPQEWILYTSLSPKALYRATDPASPVQIKPGMIILSDDVRIGEDMEDTLKRSMTNFQEPSWHLVVQDGELKRLYIPPRVIWWLTSVLDDQEEQLINRFFSVGIDESSAQDQAALELTFAPLADGRVEFPLTEDVLVCREIIRIIKSEQWIVWAPFIKNGKELAIRWTNPEERRNPGRFADLLAAYAILRSGQREAIDEGSHLKVIATTDDFYSAKALYESRAENLTTKLSDDELHMVRWLNEKAKNEIYEFTINGMAKEYKGRDGKGLASKTIERRLLGRNEKGHTSYGLIHKIKGGGLIVERKSETEDLGMRKNQKTFYHFTFDPSKFNLLDTYGNVVSLKTTEQTSKTTADQGSGSAPITPQDTGLEEEKNRKTEQTKNTRGVEVERRTLGCEIFKKKSQLPSQDGSDGSFRSLLEPDIDPLVVSPGSTRGSEPCQGCGQPAEDLIDLPGGRFCETCVAKFAEEDRARKATPVAQPPKLKSVCRPSGEALKNIEVDAAAEQQEVQEDGVADKQPCSQPTDDLPDASTCQSGAVDATEKETPPQAEKQDDLAALVKQTIAQFEAAEKPIIPSLIVEHLAVQGKLPEVVALVRDMGYAMTQYIDPVSQQLMWKRLSKQEAGFTSEENEALEKALERLKNARKVIMPFSLADAVRSTMSIRPARCSEWLEAHGWAEQPGNIWVEVGR